MITLDDVFTLALRHGRVCPRPQPWCALYELLPDTRHDLYGPIPAPPLVLQWWHATGDADKRERLREHIGWAADHGALARVHAYLANLREAQWHHEGEPAPEA